MPTVKARCVIDVIADAKSTTRRCYRGVGANKSKGHPEAIFFTNPVITARGYRFSHKCDQEHHKPVPQLDSVMVGNWIIRHTASSSNVSESP